MTDHTDDKTPSPAMPPPRAHTPFDAPIIAAQENNLYARPMTEQERTHLCDLRS